MTPTMKLLYPGIAAMFEPLGWKVRLHDTNGLLVVRLSKGADVQSRTYPYPKTNSELSEPLGLWVGELSNVGV